MERPALAAATRRAGRSTRIAPASSPVHRSRRPDEQIYSATVHPFPVAREARLGESLVAVRRHTMEACPVAGTDTAVAHRQPTDAYSCRSPGIRLEHGREVKGSTPTRRVADVQTLRPIRR